MVINIFPQIHASLVDFWEQEYDIELLKTLHDSRQYPPSIEMTVELSGQVELDSPKILSVFFEGCAAEFTPEFQFTLPTG